MESYDIQLKTYTEPDERERKSLTTRPAMQKNELAQIIDEVFAKISIGGDQAILELTEKFDKVRLSTLTVSGEEINEGISSLDTDLKIAIDRAYENIKKFHSAQQLKGQKVETSPGVVCWQEMRPIDRVGLYIPGGTAPLFSTVLMLGVPAQVAGCQEIVLCTPPNKEGKVHPAILYAAYICGISQIYKAGGSQAIAGMVLGTESIPQVYKIFGPGNQFVTAAKMKGLSHGVAIDLPAGPSEVLVYADASASASFIAADLLSQAEHGIDSQVVLVTTDATLPAKVSAELNQQLPHLSRANTAAVSLSHAYACVFTKVEIAYSFINEYAPEHLILSSDQAAEQISMVSNAGSVFIGHYTPESAGDYASGTNHTLPTAAFARAYSGVSLDSFVKKITFQEISKEGIQVLGPTIITMAQHEELTAHANAVQIRLDQI